MADDKKKFVIADNEFDDIEATTKKVVIADNEFDDIDESPKSLAPSMEDVKSGAVKIPSASTSALGDLESASWTKTANPLARTGAPQSIDAVEQTKITKPKYEPNNFGEILKKAKIGVINPDLDEVVNQSKPMNVGGMEISVRDMGEPAPMQRNVPKKEVDQDIDLLVTRTNVVRKLREQEIDKAKQFQLGLEQLKQKGADLNEAYKESPTPELEAQLNQTVKDLQDTEKAYNRSVFAQSIYENRILQTSDSIKKLANDKVPDNFFSGFYSGMKDNLESRGKAYDLATMGKAEQIQYAKDQALKAATKESTLIGEGGQMLGGVAPDILEAIGWSLAGLPFMGAASVAARQGAQQATEDFSRTFNEVKSKGLPSGRKDINGRDIMREATDDEAYDIAIRAAGMGAATGAAEGLVGTLGGGKIVKAVANKAKTQGGKIVAEKALDTASDAAIAGGMQVTRNAFDRYQGIDTKITEGVGKTMLGEALLSVPMNTFSGVGEYSKAKKETAVREVFKAINESKSNPYELQKLQSNLDVLKSQKLISDVDYNELNKKAEDYIRVVETIPTEVSDKQKAADLIIERDELEAKKESVDKAFQKPIDEKINAINDELVVMATPVELKKNTSPTPEKYGTINRNDGKGVVDLTKEDFEAEQDNMQAKAEGTAVVEKPTDEQIAKDIKDRNFATFTYESESEVPEMLKDRISSITTINGKTTIRVTLPKSEADYLLSQQATPEAIAGETIKPTTNEEANEDGEQKRGKDGEENVTEILQNEGEDGGQKVDVQEGQVLGTEGAVTTTPIAELKSKQLEIINRTNPAPNDYNTWVRKVEDIKTADEAFAAAKKDGAMYPDFTEEQMQSALNSGEVTVYSSYPIKNGVFVSPSKMNAQEYAGGKGGKLYSKVVKLDDVAWIEEGEGQYASAKEQTKKESIDVNIQQQVDKGSSNDGAVGDIAKENEALRDVESTTKALEGNQNAINVISGDEYYHGTSLPKSEADFTTANKDKGVGVRSNAFMGTSREQKSPFFFITSERDVANDFAQAKADYNNEKLNPKEKHNSRIIPFKFDEKNSKILDLTKDDYEQKLNELGFDPINDYGIGMYDESMMWEYLDNPKFYEKLKSEGYDAVKYVEPKRGVGVAVLNADKIVNSTPKGISEAYHKAKSDGSNPELVNAVESLLSKEQTKTKTNETSQKTTKETSTEGSVLEGLRDGGTKDEGGQESTELRTEEEEVTKQPKIKKDGTNKPTEVRVSESDSEVETKSPSQIRTEKRKSRSEAVNRALSVVSSDPFINALQYFIRGGKVNTEDLKKFFSKTGKQSGQEKKYDSTEFNSRIGLRSDSGLTINQIANELWNKRDVEGGLESMDFRNAVESVLLDYNGTALMVDKINQSNDMATDANKQKSEEERFYAMDEVPSEVLDEVYGMTESEAEAMYAIMNTPEFDKMQEEAYLKQQALESTENIETLESRVKNLEQLISKKQKQANKLRDENQGDMFSGVRIQMFDPSNELKNLTQQIREHNSEISNLKDRIAELKEKVVQPENQLDIEKEAKKAKPTEKLTDPKNASDLAKTYRNKFKFSPQQSVWAARLFEAKAAFMSKILGISKEDYYKQYWFGVNEGEQEGGLSQLTLPDGRKVTVKTVSAEVVNGFYSNTENALGQVKQEKMSGNQWQTQLLSRGANKEEMTWTGLEAFLKENAAKSISKSDIQQFLKENRISIVEVVKGEAEDAGYDNFQKQVEKAERKFGVRINIDENPMDGSPDVQISGEKLDNMTDDEIQELQDEVTDFVMAEAPDTENNTKFSQYQLEGEKKNYKEVLVTMPNRNLAKPKDARYKELITEQNRLEKEYNKYDDLSYSRDEKIAKEATTKREEISLEMGGVSQELDTYTPIKENTKFQSTHFDEPNILVHLRMNTRTDADGKKVLFLEEVQSDWGQQGKKEGFSLTSEEKSKLIKEHKGVLAELEDIDAKIIEAVDNKNANKNIFELTERKQELLDLSKKLKDQIFRNKAPQAPFVMDTNAWTKLGLKVALKEAVAQGADKIAWTTGEQQNERYDLSKQVKQVEWNRYTERGAVKLVTLTPITGNVIELPIDENGFVSKNAGTQFDGQRIDNVIGKEIGGKIVSENSGDLSGDGLKVGGKGMKGFYGSPTEGSLGIVGNVAKSLFKQVPKTVEINSYEKVDGRVENIGNIIQDPSTNEWVFFDLRDSTDAKNVRFENKEDAIAYYDNLKKAGKVKNTTQPSIDITPELKAQVQEGLPLFQERKGSWTKDAAKMKRIINMYEKADSTTAVHEMLGHDYLDRIIEASATNKESEADLRTIAEEYIKDTKSKEKVEDVIKTLRDFDVENNKTDKGTKVHEWFATQAEQYFATEKDVKRETPQQSKMAKIFEAFRQHLAELYDIMNKTLIAPSEPMKQVFRKVFGEENFNKAEEIRAENVEAINTLNAAALEGNKKAGGLKSLADKLKEKGLGQSEFAQDIWDAASELIANKEAKRYNVTDALKEMFPAIEGDIESMRKVLQTIGTTGELRQGAENILANPNISDEVKEKVAKMSEYTPEKLKQVGLSTNEVIDYYIGEYGEVSGLEKIKSLLDKGEFDGYTEKVAIQQSLIGMYNKLAKFGATEQIRKEALNNAVDVAEQYINQGTSLGRAINAYKLLGSLTTEGRLVWAKRQTNKYVKPAHEALKESIRDLKAELKDAYKQVDYFFEQTLGREETEGQYKELIAQYQAEIDALKARKPREPKPSKTAYKGVKVNREFKESDLANFAKDILSGGLFQDMETMTAPQKLAYGIMEKKPTNISEFAKAFGRYLGKKIDPKELESLYVQTRDLLITKDLAFADGLSTNEQLRADLEGLEVANKAKIEELERKKAEAEAKIAAKAKKGEKKEHSEELADFVIKDAKKAMNGSIAKQKTYLDEILKALKEKTADVINKGEKGKVQTAKQSEVEAIKFALDAINNGGADANMWNDAVTQVKAKIKADNDLSQAEKDNLTEYLDGYTNFIYDNLLSENKIFKVIREKLIQSGYGNGKLVNWKQIIEGADGDVNAMREIIQKLVKNQLKDYDSVQVEKVLDAIVYKYDQEINKQRKKIADKYIEKELSDKKSTKKKTAAVQGKIGKLLVENRLGILKDGNEDILNELAAAKGLKSMSAKDWKRAAELAENVENSADGILKNRAIEEMTAFIASKQPLSFMNTASSLRFAGLLGRATTVAVNLISGAIEGGLLAGGRAIRGNTSFIKESFKGVSKGGFKDILFGGGINQASKTSVEVNSSGMPYFRALEYYEGKGKKIIKSGKYVGRVLDATDSVFQEMFGSGYDRVYLEKQIKLENPKATKAEIDKMVNDALSVKYNRVDLEKQFALENPNATKAEIDQMVDDALSKTKYDAFYAQALQDVIKSGQKPTPANVKRRTYEILRESQVSQMAIDLSDLESREKTFKSEFKENRGLATLFGSMLASSSNVSRKVVEPVAEYMFKLSGYNEKQAAELAKKIGDVIPNKIMPFTRGVSNVIEKALEKDIVYGLTKSLIVNLGVNKMPTTTMEEKMAKARAEEKVKDLATTAIFTNILIYGVGSLLYAASKAWDDDEEKEGRNPEKTGVYPIQSQKTSIGSTSSAKERATPENTLVLFGQKIPLKWLGSIGAELSLTANINKALTKDSKSSGAEKVANAALDISESYMQQSFMMSQNDKQSVVALLRDENVNWDKVEDYMINDMISYGGSYVLWSGFVNQSLQGARYLSGDKSYQEAKTLSEKLQKQVGLAGITYDNKKPNYMGRPLEATEVNREGIQGLLGMFSKSYKSPIESWAENVGYKESLVSRGSKQLARIESESFVSPSNEQYDDFTDNTRKLIGKGIEFAYSKRNEVVVPLDEDGGLEVNKKTGKAYTADEYTNKLLNDMSNAIEGYKRTELVNRLDVNKYDRDEYLSKLKDYYYKLEDAMYEFYTEGSIDTDADKERFSDKVNSILPPPPEE